jgi:hypothetical protein
VSLTPKKHFSTKTCRFCVKQILENKPYGGGAKKHPIQFLGSESHPQETPFHKNVPFLRQAILQADYVRFNPNGDRGEHLSKNYLQMRKNGNT